jgi:hypothetical protein
MSEEPLPMYLKGRKITVADTGQLYSSYEEMARRFKLTNWMRDSSCREGKVGTIIGVTRHEDDHTEIILGIDCDGDQYVIALKGVELEEDDEEEMIPKTEFFNSENLVL